MNNLLLISLCLNRSKTFWLRNLPRPKRKNNNSKNLLKFTEDTNNLMTCKWSSRKAMQCNFATMSINGNAMNERWLNSTKTKKDNFFYITTESSGVTSLTFPSKLFTISLSSSLQRHLLDAWTSSPNLTHFSTQLVYILLKFIALPVLTNLWS